VNFVDLVQSELIRDTILPAPIKVLIMERARKMKVKTAPKLEIL